MRLLNRLKYLLRKQNKLLVSEINELKAKALKVCETSIERANSFFGVEVLGTRVLGP